MAAEHGGAMAVGGETEAALPELGRRRKCEHSLKEGEAELRARDCQPRWGSRGEFRRRVRGAARGRAWGSRLWRRGKAAREGVSEHTGSSRCRQARGRGRRPAATRGGVDGAWPPRDGHALPWSGARRGASAGRRAEAGQRGAGLGRGEARRAVLRDAGWAGFGRGPEVRRRPAKEEKAFFICIFKEFLNAIFQILF